MEVEEDATHSVVYMDESYTHKNYNWYEDYLFEPNDKKALETKAMNKDIQYCFIAATINVDKTIPEDYCPYSSKAHLMIPIIDVFEGDKKKTVDFNGMFESTYSIDCMKNLIDYLATINVQNAIIVIYNEKYHKILPENTPKGNVIISNWLVISNTRAWSLRIMIRKL